MEHCIINNKSVKKNREVKKAQKISKKYFKKFTYQNKKNEPKTKIQKLVDITNIEMISVIKNKEYEKNESTNSNNVKNLTKENLISLCKECNITGRSGNGFSTATKLESFQDKGGILLINGVECDPALVHDAWIYRNCLPDVEKSVQILNSIFSFDRIILATKEPESKNVSNYSNTNKSFSFEQFHLRNLFPLGYENYLIKSILNQEIPEDKIPSQMGILVMNIQTVMGIAKIVEDSSEGQNKYITVANLVDGVAKVVEVTNGQNAKSVVKSTFNTISNAKLYIGTGSACCHEMKDDEIIDEKINFLAIGNMPDYRNAKNCMGCGKCSRVCPAGVQVSKIISYVEKNGRNNPSECQKFNPQKCIGCGACTFYCNAGKDTREVVAWAKN